MKWMKIDFLSVYYVDDVEISKILIKNRADINARDDSGSTPLFISASNGNGWHKKLTQNDLVAKLKLLRKLTIFKLKFVVGYISQQYKIPLIDMY